jgi:hypothetical protein
MEISPKVAKILSFTLKPLTIHSPNVVCTGDITASRKVAEILSFTMKPFTIHSPVVRTGDG